MISTMHLTLTPMSLEFCEAIVGKDMNYFNRNNINIPKSFIEPEFVKIVGSYISMMSLGCDSSYLGWLIVETGSGEIIGDFNFNGRPNDGEIEIGYSLLEPYQNNGYGTELIKGILLWCYFQPEIQVVKAQIEVFNKKSGAILSKNGFEIINRYKSYLDYSFNMKQIPFVFPEYHLNRGIAVSSCLLGFDSKYSGSHNKVESLISLIDHFSVVPFCPEQMGGLSTPRVPAEIVEGRVLTKSGQDVTVPFNKGAEETVKLLHILNQRAIILKDGSPSCGSSRIYDGTFSMQKIKGMGKTCEKLLETFTHLLIYNDQRDLIVS